MKSAYQRLIELANEVDVPSSPEKITELNNLLAKISKDDLDNKDFSLIDDLICILFNTDNILPQNAKKTTELLKCIRDLAVETDE